MARRITRSTVNEQQYSAPEFPHSGFSLSYRRYTNFQLGKIHIGGFQWCMPGDKISGKTRADNMTFERMITPIVSPVNAMQYNIFLPIRPLDRSFKKGITPTKLNAMSANWSMPLFNTRYLVDQVLRAYMNVPISGNIGELWSNFFGIFAGAGSATTLQEWYTANAALFPQYNSLQSLLYSSDSDKGLITEIISNLTTNGTRICNMADQVYMRDNLLDVAALITAKLGSADSPLSGSMLLSDFLDLFLGTLLEPWVGRYSYYAELKYEFVRPFDVYRISRGLSRTIGDYNSLIAAFSETPQNEYAIRMMYAVWYELFRNVDLEPVGGNLPDWQEWSSTSIFDMSAGGNLCYLLYRFRPWERDMFISAQIDDLSRHLWAPILAQSDVAASYHVSDLNNNDAQSTLDPDPNNPSGFRKPSGLNVGYRDQLTDQDVTVWCPIPTNIQDMLSSIDKEFKDVYGLDLNTLRQTQMLERYLKRNYLFGDEYQDRMLAHYNSRVSDMRINKPEILSQSMDGYNMRQEVSNVSTDETKVGDRTATATINVNGEEYTTFCEEFGIMLSIVCFMPRSMYDGTCPQNYLGKQIDLPIPEFASNNEEFGRKSEIAGSGLASIGATGDDNRYIFGRYPAYHAWRSRVDEVGGKFLDEMQDCTFRRFFGMFSDDTTPKLNYFFIHCRPNLQMFADSVAYDGQIYGDLVHECFVERVLPTPVEVI